MRINPNAILTDLEGKPIQMVENGPEATFARVVIHSLNTPEQNDDGSKKWDKFVLCKKLHKAAEAGTCVDVTVEEAALIKQSIGKNFVPIVVGAVYEVIEGAPHE